MRFFIWFGMWLILTAPVFAQLMTLGVGAGGAVVVVLTPCTSTATLTPEVSTDGGTTWIATRFYNASTQTASATVAATGTYDIMGTGGKSHARVRISAFTSGTVTGNLRATSQAPSANDAEATTAFLVTQPTPAGTNFLGSVRADIIV